MILKFFKFYKKTIILFFVILSSNVSLAQRFEIIPTVTLSTPGSGTYTVPTSTTLGPDEYVDEIEVDIVIVGGGGGGGRGEGAGGGGGGQVVAFTVNASPGNSFSYSVGAGGAGSVIDEAAGSPGTPTSFDTQTANPGLGGGGGIAGRGERSGNGNAGGAGVSAGGNRRAGGGGGGASGDGTGGAVMTGPPTALGGNGGSGLLGYGGGGGGSARANNQTQGFGIDGGTNGSAGSASNASNGGGGGGGGIRGGNGGDGLVIISATLIILPVDYAYINASFDNKSRTAHITWATFKEWENAHFEIERAINNVKTFENIAKVEGVGYSDVRTDYSFTDGNLPLLGSMAYYRLKQVDFSGFIAYSKTVGMRISQVGITKGVWRAYPNPILGEQLKISLLDRSRYDGEKITFRVVHPILTTQAITVNSENEMNEQLAILIPRIPKGLMVIEIQWGKNVEHIKVLRK